MDTMVYPRTPADAGNDVRAVQTLLVYKHSLSCPINGVYDLGTRNAVATFQARRGLPQTGNVDNSTFVAIVR